jgi:hypothetical protein
MSVEENCYPALLWRVGQSQKKKERRERESINLFFSRRQSIQFNNVTAGEARTARLRRLGNRRNACSAENDNLQGNANRKELMKGKQNI